MHFNLSHSQTDCGRWDTARGAPPRLVSPPTGGQIEMHPANFEAFEEKYGGKVLVIFSSKVGNKKEVKNKEVLHEIATEIERLK